MIAHFSRSSRMMCTGIVLSLGWFLFESCDCDETKEDQFPGFWVSCINNQPTLMTYSGNNPTVVSTSPAGGFNPSDYDCTHDSGSPPYRGSESGAPFQQGSPSGPGGYARKDATGTGTAFLPQQWQILPFVPDVPPPTTPAACTSSFPDVFQTDQTLAMVTRFSTCPFQEKTTIPVVAAPLQVAVTPDGSTAIVTSFNNAVSFINLSTNQVTSTLTTDPSVNPHGIAISPDGTRLYITSFNPDNSVVLEIDMATHNILATIPTITYPQGAILSPDGSQLWITSPYAGAVDVIDTLTFTEVTRLNISFAYDVAFNSTGTRAYVTSQAVSPGQVFVVDTGSYQTINTYTVGVGPTDISISYGDQFLVVNNNGDVTITVIDLVKGTQSTTSVGGSPTGIAWVH